MNRREFAKNLSAVAAVLLSPLPQLRKAFAGGGGATTVFDYSNGFAGSAAAIPLRDANLTGSVIQLINTQGHNSACAWYATKQPPTAFTTQFKFQPTGLGTEPVQSGMTFCIQNVVAPPGQPGYTGTDYAGDANMCGYGGATTQYPPVDSVSIKFDASNVDGQPYAAGKQPSSTGMYFNGGPSVVSGGSLGLVPWNDLGPYDINFYSGDTYEVTIVYDGSLLTMVILDTTTNAQARFAWPLDLANTTNTKGNYVGFTAGTSQRGQFNLLGWSYSSGYNTRLATPTFSPSPGQYTGTKTVVITYPAGSTCYYTTNGLLPTSASTKYTGPITVSANAVIQAVAIQSGFTDSLVGLGAYQVGNANVINFPTGFAAGSLVNAGYASLSGSTYQLSDTTLGTSGAVWFPARVNVQKFSTAFSLQFQKSRFADGMCFVLQNDPPLYASSSGNTINWSGGTTALGLCGKGFGYGGLNASNGPANNGGGFNGTSWGLLNSVAIAFDNYTMANSVGVYTNGGNPNGSQVPTGLTFNNGNVFDVSLAYSGTTLVFTMTDTTTKATFTHNFTIDIPKAVGGATAYAGFTAGTGGAAMLQAVTAWTYTAQTAPAPVLPDPPTNVRFQ